jgi:hypothetical protein
LSSGKQSEDDCTADKASVELSDSLRGAADLNAENIQVQGRRVVLLRDGISEVEDASAHDVQFCISQLNEFGHLCISIFQPNRQARAQIKINQQILGLIIQQAEHRARMGTDGHA